MKSPASTHKATIQIRSMKLCQNWRRLNPRCDSSITSMAGLAEGCGAALFLIDSEHAGKKFGQIETAFGQLSKNTLAHRNGVAGMNGKDGAPGFGLTLGINPEEV